VIKDVESGFDDQIEVLLNMEDKSKDELEKFSSNHRELKEDLSNLNEVIKDNKISSKLLTIFKFIRLKLSVIFKFIRLKKEVIKYEYE